MVVGCINGESISRANKKFEKDCKDYSVAVMLEISNKMQWELNYPNMIPAGGVMDLVPVTVLPGIKEAAVMRKKGYWATGSYGTVSWDVKDKNLQVIVMWDAPFNFNINDNILAVGIAPKGTNDEATFEEMRNGQATYFERCGNWNKTRTPISFSSSGIGINGTMDASHHPVIRIAVYED